MYEESKHSDKQFLVNLGNRIKNIRESKGIKQTEIAYRCHFDKSSYNTIEAGKRNITTLTLKKISKALDVSVKDFFVESFE